MFSLRLMTGGSQTSPRTAGPGGPVHIVDFQMTLERLALGQTSACRQRTLEGSFLILGAHFTRTGVRTTTVWKPRVQSHGKGSLNDRIDHLDEILLVDTILQQF